MVRAVVVLVLVLGGLAEADAPATGVIAGRVLDARTRAPLPDLVVTAASTQGRTASRTHADGTFRISGLLPGRYDLEYSSPPRPWLLFTRYDVRVRLLAVTYVEQAFDPEQDEREGKGAGWGLDPTNRSTITALDRADLDRTIFNSPSHGGVVGVAPTSASDGYDAAWAEATSFDNRFVVDGIDTSNVRDGGNDTWLPAELVDGVAVLTGGGSAAVTRHAGASIAAITRSGTNQLHGSVFATYAPGFLVGAQQRTDEVRDIIDVEGRQGSRLSLGAEVGGPLVRDHAWFWVGFAPQFNRTALVRTISTHTDCRERRADGTLSGCDAAYADGVVDLDPATGEPMLRSIETTVRTQPTRSFPAIAKIDLDVGGHRASATAILVPSSSETPATLGTRSTGTREWGTTADLGARWSREVRDGALRFDASASWHHRSYELGGVDATAERTAQVFLVSPSLAQLSNLGLESPAVGAACRDGGFEDEFREIENCPLGGYYDGGTGSLRRERDDRLRTDASATARIRAAGLHTVQAGLALVVERSATARALSGGRSFSQFLGSRPLTPRRSSTPPTSWSIALVCCRSIVLTT